MSDLLAGEVRVRLGWAVNKGAEGIARFGDLPAGQVFVQGTRQLVVVVPSVQRVDHHHCGDGDERGDRAGNPVHRLG
ncbi:hypothetical protein SMC26_29160 [Actinomadura fulvescens]|uniref:hypothetical protein n=1 Tax=Actinomadura fulvescens TaxID=46160 RepID=UPI0031E119EA